VLDPPGLRQELRVLQLVAGHLVAAVVEDHESGARRPLIDRAYEVSHVAFPSAGSVIWFTGGLLS
jgi:hypothetical protein